MNSVFEILSISLLLVIFGQVTRGSLPMVVLQLGRGNSLSYTRG